jgi:hypothetical protein
MFPGRSTRLPDTADLNILTLRPIQPQVRRRKTKSPVVAAGMPDSLEHLAR